MDFWVTLPPEMLTVTRDGQLSGSAPVVPVGSRGQRRPQHRLWPVVPVVPVPGGAGEWPTYYLPTHPHSTPYSSPSPPLANISHN